MHHCEGCTWWQLLRLCAVHVGLLLRGGHGLVLGGGRHGGGRRPGAAGVGGHHPLHLLRRLLLRVLGRRRLLRHLMLLHLHLLLLLHLRVMLLGCRQCHLRVGHPKRWEALTDWHLSDLCTSNESKS